MSKVKGVARTENHQLNLQLSEFQLLVYLFTTSLFHSPCSHGIIFS